VFRNIEIIINPASGNDEPILNRLNDTIKDYDVKWHVCVTQPDYGAGQLAADALERGVDLIAVYGGDGTVHDAAAPLIGGSVPLCILPGGTGNALAGQLGIPRGLPEALKLALDGSPNILTIDTALINGDPFILNAGTGLYGSLVNVADRDMKSQYGWIAYILSGLQSLTQPENVTYTLTLDGERVEQEAVACLVTNVRSFGVLGLSLPNMVLIDDGLLDCFLIDASLRSALTSLGSLAGNQQAIEALSHWQFRELKIEAETPQGIYVDGEENAIAETPAVLSVVPASLKVIVPPDEAE
jgi:YegS/Rv2252/BmrU family lipid kinase